MSLATTQKSFPATASTVLHAAESDHRRDEPEVGRRPSPPERGRKSGGKEEQTKTQWGCTLNIKTVRMLLLVDARPRTGAVQPGSPDPLTSNTSRGLTQNGLKSATPQHHCAKRRQERPLAAAVLKGVPTAPNHSCRCPFRIGTSPTDAHGPQHTRHCSGTARIGAAMDQRMPRPPPQVRQQVQPAPAQRDRRAQTPMPRGARARRGGR